MQSRDKAGEILSRFPGPVTLYPSRRKWLYVLLASAAFVVAGLLLIASPLAYHNMLGWASLVFFGLGMLVAIVVLLPGTSYLKLDREGFEIVMLFRRFTVRWRDATGFEAAEIRPGSPRIVVFDDANSKGRAIAKLNVALFGRMGGLPDIDGLSAETLADVMAHWRELAVRRR